MDRRINELTVSAGRGHGQTVANMVCCHCQQNVEARKTLMTAYGSDTNDDGVDFKLLGKDSIILFRSSCLIKCIYTDLLFYRVYL